MHGLSLAFQDYLLFYTLGVYKWLIWSDILSAFENSIDPEPFKVAEYLVFESLTPEFQTRWA